MAFLAVALALGSSIGLMLGTREARRQPPHREEPSLFGTLRPPAPPPAIAQRPARGAEETTAVSSPAPPPAASPALTVDKGWRPAVLPATPPATGTIASHEDPHVIYEETVTAPGPARAAPVAPGEGGVERKPVLSANLGAFTFHPPAGPAPLWLRNALAMPDLRGRPMIAIIVDDMGMDRKRAERAMALPGPVTLSFLPYASEVSKQAALARARGHEVMLHLPMEPDNPTIDPGPHALRIGRTPAEILHDLDWSLAQFDGYVAVNNHMGSRFTRDAELMRPVLQALQARGLFFLDSRTTAATAGPRLAREIGLPHLERDVFLDNIDTREEVLTRLTELERIAREDGYGIAIGHPRDATLDVLEAWLDHLRARGFVLVPISTVMRVRLAAEQERPRAQAVGG